MRIHSHLRNDLFRTRICVLFSVSDPDPDPDSRVFWIRIRIRNPDPDPGSSKKILKVISPPKNCQNIKLKKFKLKNA